LKFLELLVPAFRGAVEGDAGGGFHHAAAVFGWLSV
jgi:hypothetical protein